jgi:phosphomannomutase
MCPQTTSAGGRFPDSSIFREYDIRGVVGSTLHAQDAYSIARAFASLVVKEPKPFICIGRDGRLSSPELAEAIAQGILDAGVEVVDIGVGPTPMLYFASYTQKASGGIMITGSHNPPDHNGFKFVLQNKPFYADEIRALEQTIRQNHFASGKGTRRALDIRKEYTAKLAQAYNSEKSLKVAWDAGNGATGEIMQALCKALPGKHTMLNATIDGTFPAHHPDPTEAKNLAQLIDTVRAQKCDLGIAFDGDGDRIGVVDDEGEILWGDQLLILLAKEVLREKPGATIIADVKASQVLFDFIAARGGKPLMWKTGHSHIKAKMAEVGAPLAGEMSGHIFFADKYYGYDDALYAAVRVLEMLAQTDKKLSDLRKQLEKRCSTPEIRFACEDNRKFAVIEEVKARLAKTSTTLSDVDGVRVYTQDGWWLLRASNTQPMLVARCEGADDSGLARLKQALQAELEQCGVKLPN